MRLYLLFIKTPRDCQDSCTLTDCCILTSQTVKLMRPTWKKKDQTKTNKIPHHEILKYNFSVLLFPLWLSNRRCKIFQHFQVEFLGNPLVPTTEAWRKISSIPGLIWQRKESNNSARQPPKTRARGWFWVCLNQLELYCRLQEKPPGPVLPKNPREGKPKQIPVWLFSTPCQNKKKQFKRSPSALQWYIWECHTSRGTVPLS